MIIKKGKVMKELTIEQKAAAYDKALGRAKELLEIGVKDTRDKRVVLSFFPELKESEDKEVRQAIINFFKSEREDGVAVLHFGVNIEKMIAWLEKQGEQKSVINVPPREVILSIWDLGNEWKELTNGSISTEYGTQLDYIQKHWHESEYYSKEKQGEQESAVYIPKFHVGDKLVSTKNPSLTYEVLEVGHINELGNQDYKVKILTDGKAKEPRNIHYMECYKVDEWAKLIEQKPAWSEEDERILKATINTVLIARNSCEEDDDVKDRFDDELRWLKSIKDRVQPKQEWSKDDEQYLLVCKNALAKYQTTDKWDAHIIFHWLENKIKSLRPHNTCKPSDGQIKACKEVYADILSAKGFDLGTINSELNRLEEKLKKHLEE